MMTTAELLALESLLNYIDLDGWHYYDSEKYITILSDYLKGQYSTGCLNHASD